MNPNEVAGGLGAGFADAWNRHDMNAFANLFHDDASFVNVVGAHMRGREQIRQQHANIHAGPYRSSHLVFEVEDAREIADTVVVAHGRSRLTGDERAPGKTRQTRLTMVIERRDLEGWKIIAAQNTALAVVPPEG